MPSNLLIEQLELINNVFKNSVDTKEYTDNLPRIRKPLYHHQRTLLQGMHTFVQNSTLGFEVIGQKIHSKIGIIADPAGTGKTLTALSYLSSPPRLQRLGELSPASNRFFYSNTIEHNADIQYVDASATNLVIVPPNLLINWQEEITNSTYLTHFIVDTKRILRNRTTVALLPAADVVIASTKTYRFLQEFAITHGIRWKTVIIDDAANIHLTANDPPLEFDFLWFITSSWLPFIFKNIYLSPTNLHHISDRINLHPETQKWLNEIQNYEQLSTIIQSSTYFRNYIPYSHDSRWSIILRNSASTLQNSYELPPIHTMSVPCRIMYSLSNLRSIPNLRIAEKTPSILRGLSVPEYESSSALITKYTDKESIVTRKLTEDCSICLEMPVNKILTTCCMNIFCGHCILRHILNSNVCPTCRSTLSVDSLAYLPTNEERLPTLQSPLLTKQEQCIDIIRRNPGGQFLIYTAFANTYYQLIEGLENLDVTFERLDGNNGGRVSRNFASGNTKVVFLSKFQEVSGLNFTKATHFIFFFDFYFSDRYNYLLTAVNRLTRTQSLLAIHLVSEEL
jgi:SNF2 family DNA or RNA helicase